MTEWVSERIMVVYAGRFRRSPLSGIEATVFRRHWSVVVMPLDRKESQ